MKERVKTILLIAAAVVIASDVVVRVAEWYVRCSNVWDFFKGE